MLVPTVCRAPPHSTLPSIRSRRDSTPQRARRLARDTRCCRASGRGLPPTRPSIAMSLSRSNGSCPDSAWLPSPYLTSGKRGARSRNRWGRRVSHKSTGSPTCPSPGIRIFRLFLQLRGAYLASLGPSPSISLGNRAGKARPFVYHDISLRLYRNRAILEVSPNESGGTMSEPASILRVTVGPPCTPRCSEVRQGQRGPRPGAQG